MSEEQENPLDKPAEESAADMHREALIEQATTAFRLGRKVVLTSVGLTVMGVEELQLLLQRSVARGEIVQHDAQKTISRLRRQAADGTSSAISSRVATLLNKLPGVSIEYKASDAQSLAEGALVGKEDTKQ